MTTDPRGELAPADTAPCELAPKKDPRGELAPADTARCELAPKKDPRGQLAAACHLLARGALSPGASGNVSVRVGDTILVSPTGSSLSRVRPEDFAVVTLAGELVHDSGARPSKEASFHAAMYRVRPSARAVVHLHSPHAAALSTVLASVPGAELPEHTLYHPMRLGRVPVVAALPPGSAELASAVEAAAVEHHALLLARHGSVVAGTSLDHAVDLAEELEAAAQVALLVMATCDPGR